VDECKLLADGFAGGGDRSGGGAGMGGGDVMTRAGGSLDLPQIKTQEQKLASKGNARQILPPPRHLYAI
jgi:hypothetical protein